MKLEKGVDASLLNFEIVARNREKRYYEITMSKEMVKKQGRLVHLHHELMISRFHFMPGKACEKSVGKVKLLGFFRGPQLWNDVEFSKVVVNPTGTLTETEQLEKLPHRPDAFFGLHFPDLAGEDRNQYFFFEADRQTTSPTKIQRKLRPHFHYVVKQKST